MMPKVSLATPKWVSNVSLATRATQAAKQDGRAQAHTRTPALVHLKGSEIACKQQAAQPAR
jgi:hypothetical protein